MKKLLTIMLAVLLAVPAIAASAEDNVKNADIIIVGAGGAARGVVSALKGEGCASITIANRTLERAVALAKEMGVASAAFTDLGTGFDVVVNATSAGLSNAAPAVPGTIFKGIEIAYDLFYAKNPTPFMLSLIHI